MAGSARAALVYTHRWLGIAGCIVFCAWFVSGVVMMYVRMPELSADERLARLPALDLTAVRLPADQAAAAAGIAPAAVSALKVGMLDGRPVYRLAEGRVWSAVYADTGEPLRAVDASMALRVVASAVPDHAATATHHARLTAPDQWTLYARQYLPMHRIALNDADDTHVYVSERTGEPILKTTRAQRWWGYAGPVVHWLYFTPLRQHTAVWRQLVIGASLLGCVLCLTGLAWGLWRFSPAGRYRLRRQPARSPYAGWMRWHHLAGLAVGVVAFTWILSGLFSMSPWNWSPGSAPTAAQRVGIAGGALRLDLVTPARLRAARRALAPAVDARELEIVQVAGEPLVRAFRTPPHDVAAWNGPFRRAPVRLPHAFVALTRPGAPFARLAASVTARAARAAMPGAAVADEAWLDAYDAYYYDQHGTLPLPVLRVRFADEARTWLYVDPSRGEAVLNHTVRSRAERWLYHGLHSLDFPWLYRTRPLWDVLLVVLSVGGTVLSASAMRPAWRRVHARLGEFRARAGSGRMNGLERAGVVQR